MNDFVAFVKTSVTLVVKPQIKGTIRPLYNNLNKRPILFYQPWTDLYVVDKSDTPQKKTSH